jgi:peptide/nickel transport system permease protein
LDSIIQVGAAALGAVPRLVLVLALAALQPASPIWLLLILAFTCWTSTARLVRASVLQVRLASYVEAAKALGLSDWQIISRYILPNTWPALRAALPLSLATCISLQTTLAFLGIGLPPDWADWGRTIANARLTPAAWWLMAGAAVPLAVTIIALRSLFDMRKTAVLP